MIRDAINTAFRKKKRRGWDKWPKMYVFVDLHDVIIKGTYTRKNDGREFYPYAEEVLRHMTKDKRFCLVLWTSSHKDAIDDIYLWLCNHNIYFDYINENPECTSNDLLDVSSKPYFDLLFEDKAGFNGDLDWLVIKNTLIELKEW